MSKKEKKTITINIDEKLFKEIKTAAFVRCMSGRDNTILDYFSLMIVKAIHDENDTLNLELKDHK